jgi:hypothetical protein
MGERGKAQQYCILQRLNSRPFEDLNELPSGFISSEHDPFDQVHGLGWSATNPATTHVASSIYDCFADDTWMEIQNVYEYFSFLSSSLACLPQGISKPAA